jgi:hypothetical protein
MDKEEHFSHKKLKYCSCIHFTMQDSEKAETSSHSFKRYPKVTFMLEDAFLQDGKELVEDIHKNFIKEAAIVYENDNNEGQQEFFTYKTVLGANVDDDPLRFVTMVFLNNKWISVYTTIDTDTNQVETGLLGIQSKDSSRLARDVGQQICKKIASR